MQNDGDDEPDLPLNVPSRGTKGGMGKPPKALKASKASAPKSSGKSSGGFGAALKGASKAAGKGKISAPKAQNFVKASVGTKKAAPQFSIPKPKQPSAKITPMKKRGR